MPKRRPSSRPIEINPEFRRALDLMENSRQHVFITGRAGTGKSTLLDYFRGHTQKQVAVLAPTGVAALNVRGQTIHSFFGFKPDITADKVKKVSASRQDLYEKFDAIIIDEISMVRADLLDCVEKFLRLNGRNSRQFFGGTQMFFIGDLYQLPPVVTSSEKAIFTDRYETPYFFSSRIFNEPDFDMEFVELEKIYRQTEADFIGLLNAIRNKSITDEEIERLNKNCQPDFIPPDDGFYISLTSTNDLATARNLEKLKSLPGRSFVCQGLLEGKFDRSSLPTDEILTLKNGAQVMLVNNDRKGRWVNGTLGKVVNIPRHKGQNDAIVVELKEGPTAEVTPYTWELFEYRYDKDTKKVYTETTGSFIQYPLRLAWAVTIHKSQGKTFDNVIIDLGRGTFAHGQVYVALSRCTNFKGIVLKQKIKRGHIRMDWRVIKFLTRFQYRKADERASYTDRRRMIEEAMSRKADLEIVYLKTDDTKSRRRIRPLAIEEMEYMGKLFEGVRAYCFLRREERVFRIDRMLEIASLKPEPES